MATRKEDELTSVHIQRLAAAISCKKMKSIAIRYFNMKQETIGNIGESISNAEDFNGLILQHWANKNPKTQIRVRIILSTRVLKLIND